MRKGLSSNQLNAEGCGGDQINIPDREQSDPTPSITGYNGFDNSGIRNWGQFEL